MKTQNLNQAKFLIRELRSLLEYIKKEDYDEELKELMRTLKKIVHK